MSCADKKDAIRELYDFIRFDYNPYHNTLYVLHEDSEECAWNRLQNKLSWNMKIVKQRVKLLDTMREVDNRVLKIKLN